MHATLPLLRATDFPPVRRRKLETLQVNLGYRCNQSCMHCHVAAGPNRTEEMSRPNVEAVLAFMASHRIATLDLTGGAPELYLNMQTGYDLEAAEERLQDELVEIHPSNPKLPRVSPTRLAGFRREIPAAALPRRKRAPG